MNRLERGALAFHIKAHSVNDAIAALDRIGNGLCVTHVTLDLFDLVISALKQV